MRLRSCTTRSLSWVHPLCIISALKNECVCMPTARQFHEDLRVLQTQQAISGGPPVPGGNYGGYQEGGRGRGGP